MKKIIISFLAAMALASTSLIAADANSTKACGDCCKMKKECNCSKDAPCHHKKTKACAGKETNASK